MAGMQGLIPPLAGQLGSPEKLLLPLAAERWPQAESLLWSMHWPLQPRLEWALENCCSSVPSGQSANCCYVVPIVDRLIQATHLWWGWVSSVQGEAVAVEAFAQRRS